MSSYRVLLQHEFLLAGRRWSPLRAMNILIMMGAAFFFGTRWTDLGVLQNRVVLVAWILAGLPMVWMVLGSLRAYSQLFLADDTVLLLIQPLTRTVLYGYRLTQLYLANLIPAGVAAAYFLGMRWASHDLLIFQGRQLLLYLLTWWCLSAPMQITMALLLARARWLVMCVMAGLILLVVTTWSEAGADGMGVVLPPFVLSNWLFAIPLFVALIVLFLMLSHWLVQAWFTDEYSRLQATQRIGKTWLWAWNELAHGMIPRRIRTLLFRDLAILLRGGFPRGLIILSGLMIVPVLFWYDVSSLQVPVDEELVVEFRLLCYVMFSSVGASYCTAFDFLKTRGLYFGLDKSLPESPSLTLYGHLCTTVVMQIPYLVGFVLLLLAYQVNYPELDAMWLAGKFVALAMLISLHSCVFALGEFDGQEIGPEQSYVVSVTVLGLAAALCMLKFFWLIPVFFLWHGAMIAKAKVKVGRMEVLS